MKIAIISDIHLGDSACVMIYYDKKHNVCKKGSRYDEFKNTINKNLGENIDYLVLLGDILDFAI